MKKNEIINQWVARAKSNLLRAQHSYNTNEIFLEDLLFDCQQCGKSVKSYNLIFRC